jgi:hypothetical protein
VHVTDAEAAGRIVAASIEEYEAECFDQNGAPPLGTLMVTVDGEPAVYAAVASISTEGIDPSRPLVPHGAADEDLETVLSRNPHLPLLLRTSFTARVIASGDTGALYHRLPDVPPPLFARVRACADEETGHFVAGLAFLEPLLAGANGEDEVVTAFLRRVSRSQRDASRFLVEAGRRLVPLLSREPDRLTAILRSIRP